MFSGSAFAAQAAAYTSNSMHVRDALQNGAVIKHKNKKKRNCTTETVQVCVNIRDFAVVRALRLTISPPFISATVARPEQCCGWYAASK